MRKVLAVIRREFVERVRTRWFWIGTVLGPVLMIAIIGFQMLLAGQGGGHREIALMDRTSTAFGADLASQLQRAIPRFHVVRVAAGAGVADSLLAEVEAKRIDGYLMVSDSTLTDGAAEYRGSNVSSIGDMEQLHAALQRVLFAARLEERGIDTLLVQQAQVTLNLETHKIMGRKLTGESGTQSFMTGFGMAILLFVAILMYGVNVMSSVLEEKTTRVVEVLVSSLKPFQLMVGKVIGAGAVGIVQLSVWIVSAKLLSGAQHRAALANPAAITPSFQFPNIPTATLVIFVLYFLLGYFLYAGIYAAVGAMSSTEAEARQAQVPVQLLLMVPYLSFFALLNDPNSRIAVWLTMIPFWSPIATPVRWGASPFPVIQLVVSLSILLVTVIFVTWVASRIYRVGILMTGKRPSLRELVRWVRTA
ncbi:MAG TPA: ABC transporter permease [Gemmatimonadales bacterium]|nr:ABC transporter permease [Gemmatimonadales bacterium]